jgi:hypothetical protein
MQAARFVASWFETRFALLTMRFFFVMAGLVPAIHVFGGREKKARRGWPQQVRP